MASTKGRPAGAGTRTTLRELLPDVEALPPGPPVSPPESPPARAGSGVKVFRKARPFVEGIDAGRRWGRAADTPERVVRDLARGRFFPGREIDLHRKSGPAATQVLKAAVLQARRDGIRVLRVICGQGTHSGAAGPVLPSIVAEQLSGPLSRHVAAFAAAPPRLGGNGAILVRLRRKG